MTRRDDNWSGCARGRCRSRWRPTTFREIGHRLVDQIAGLPGGLARRPVTPDESPAQVRAAIAARPSAAGIGHGTRRAHWRKRPNLLFDHSLFNGHPRFFGYITSSAGAHRRARRFARGGGELRTSARGSWRRWPPRSRRRRFAGSPEFIGYPADCGGLLVSGGNMANFVGFLAARAAKAPAATMRKAWRAGGAAPLRCYCVERNAHLDAEGRGSVRPGHRRDPLDSVRRAAADGRGGAAHARSQTDIERGRPAVPRRRAPPGRVSTGAVDPLPEIGGGLPANTSLWFHVDGAYGGLAAGVPGAPDDLRGLALADSVAVDPHKWLYAPLEAGCALVRNPRHLRDAFSYRPPYYNFDTEVINYFDLGPQNSRGFRALKVWLALRQAGREGYLRMIGDDMRSRASFTGFLARTRISKRSPATSASRLFAMCPRVCGGHRDRGGGDDLNRLNQDCWAAGEERRSVPLQRGGRRQVCAARLHRQLPDVAGRHRGAARAGGAVGEGVRPGGRIRLAAKHRAFGIEGRFCGGLLQRHREGCGRATLRTHWVTVRPRANLDFLPAPGAEIFIHLACVTVPTSRHGRRLAFDR